MRPVCLPVLLCLSLCFAGAAHAARDAWSVGEWLGGKIFIGEDITLGLAKDGFFAMRINPPGKPLQNLTGLWNLSPDGIELKLFNLQDAEIVLSVGREALHSSLGEHGQTTLTPSTEKKATFRMTGLLERKGDIFFLNDAASGRSFAVNTRSDAKEGKFAIAEVIFDSDGVHGGEVLKHSGSVPRLYERPKEKQDPEIFIKEACNRVWLFPPMAGFDKIGLRFGTPNKKGDSADIIGDFEVTGRGLRLEGTYTLAGDNLTLAAAHASVRNLEILGAEEIARSLLGKSTWYLSGRGLELRSDSGIILLVAQ